MEKLEWHPVFYNGLETNVEVTKCGRVRRIKVHWLKYNTSAKLGEIDFNKLSSSKGYNQIGIQIKGLQKRIVQVHQLVAAAFLNYQWNGSKLVIDHIDSNKQNNNLNNLKVVTLRENSSKERTKKSGTPVGVWFEKKVNKYQSQIYINGKKITIGRYNTIEEASNAYKNKLKEISIHKNN